MGVGFFFFGGGVQGGCERERGGGRFGGQGGCERRFEVFVKIQIKLLGGGVECGASDLGGLGGVRVDVNEELKFL